MVKLFLKSFRRRRLFEKRRHPKNLSYVLSIICFQTVSYACTVFFRTDFADSLLFHFPRRLLPFRRLRRATH
ncbi:hypothetical protein FYB92_01970 [Novacetimonas sp. GS1]